MSVGVTGGILGAGWPITRGKGFARFVLVSMTVGAEPAVGSLEAVPAGIPGARLGYTAAR